MRRLRDGPVVLREDAELQVARAEIRIARRRSCARAGKSQLMSPRNVNSGIAGELLADVVVGEAQHAADLRGVIAVPAEEPAVVVAQRRPLLDDELFGVAAADAQQPLVVLPDGLVVLRLRIPSIPLVREVGLVEELRPRDLPLALHRIHAVSDVLSSLEARASLRSRECRFRAASCRSPRRDVPAPAARIPSRRAASRGTGS